MVAVGLFVCLFVCFCDQTWITIRGQSGVLFGSLFQKFSEKVKSILWLLTAVHLMPLHPPQKYKLYNTDPQSCL